jgi:hypothetical protein
MSLPVLVVMVVVGIAAIVAAVHLSGGSRVALIDEAGARARFSADFPDEAASEVWLTADRRTAFLRLGGNRLGLVHAIGQRQLTRMPAAGDIVDLARPAPDAVALTLADFTFPGGVFRFVAEDGADAVFATLAGLKARTATERA